MKLAISERWLNRSQSKWRGYIRKTLFVIVAWASLGGSHALANSPYIDFFGRNLFLGIAYHRYGCLNNSSDSVHGVITSNNTYQGFTNQQYCFNGRSYAQTRREASIYLGWRTAPTDAWLGYYFGLANWDYGTALVGTNPRDIRNYSHSLQTSYANNDTFGISPRSVSGAPNACNYNVITNCNSDCWMRDFSTRGWGSGGAVPIASPCLGRFGAVSQQAYASAVSSGQAMPGTAAMHADTDLYVDYNLELADEQARVEGLTFDEVRELTFFGAVGMRTTQPHVVEDVLGRELTSGEVERLNEILRQADEALTARLHEHVEGASPLGTRWATIQAAEQEYIDQFRSAFGIDSDGFDRMLRPDPDLPDPEPLDLILPDPPQE